MQRHSFQYGIKKIHTVIPTITTSMPKSQDSCRTVTSSTCQHKNISKYNQIRIEKGIKTLKAPLFPL